MSKTKALVYCSLFTALIAVGAFIRVPIPVLPFTLQYLFTMLAGLLLGPRLGTISTVAYMLLGLAGVLWLTIAGANAPSEWLARGLGWVQAQFSALLTALRAPLWLHGLLVDGMFRFIAAFEGEIPGASAKDCGNYLDMNLPMAKWLARKYLDEVLYDITEDRLVYPK